MKENNNIFWNVAFSFGILYAILGMVFMLINDPMAGKDNITNQIIGFIALFVFIFITTAAVWYYRGKGQTITLGTAIKLGLAIGLIGGSLLAVYTYFYFKYINPEAIDFIMEKARETLENNEQLTEEMVEKQMEMVQKITFPSQIIAQIFVGVFYGLIGGVLGGLVFKTKVEDYY